MDHGFLGGRGMNGKYILRGIEMNDKYSISRVKNLHRSQSVVGSPVLREASSIFWVPH